MAPRIREMFWDAVRRLKNEELKGLVKFWTGTEAFPVMPLVLTGPSRKPGCIEASTCSNLLRLPIEVVNFNRTGFDHLLQAALMDPNNFNMV